MNTSLAVRVAHEHWEAEVLRFTQHHPRCMAQALACQAHYLYGVPMHWMHDWSMPVPLCVQSAQGATLTCLDGHVYTDFCLGDSGAMFGHSPAPVALALAQQATRGLTTMLPSIRSAEVGAQLSAVFRLPKWQICLSASDANRFVLRWARAITGRPKVLVFEGCYHGSVEDTLADRKPMEPGVAASVGRSTVVHRESVLGQVHELAKSTELVPFNDVDALQQALASKEVACVLAEPALTNCGLVLPEPGFWSAVQRACQETGTLLAMDETHTLSAGWGGWCAVHQLTPDFVIVGKAIAGGVPAAAYGFSEAVAARMQQVKDSASPGHSGIGTTLSASLLALSALHACLQEVMVPRHYETMLTGATVLENGLRALLARRAVAWSVCRLGARLEVQFCDAPPRNAAQAHACADEPLARCLHLALLNRGYLLTPFHNMLLVSPETTVVQIEGLLTELEAVLRGWQSQSL